MSRGQFRCSESGEPPAPVAKFSRHGTNNFTVNSDAREYCECRYVQRCTARREGTEMCLFPSRGHQEISGTTLSPLGNTRKLRDSWRWRTLPLLKLSPSKVIPTPPPRQPPHHHPCISFIAEPMY